MKPAIMTSGKKAGLRDQDDTLTLEVLFPRMPRTERAEIELTNGDEPRIRIKAGPKVNVEILEAEPPKTWREGGRKKKKRK